MWRLRSSAAPMVTARRVRGSLYAVALVVFLGSSGVAATDAPDTAPPGEVSALAAEAEALDPLVQEEVAFRYLPTWSQLLKGSSGESSATALIATGCEVRNQGQPVLDESPSVVMVPSHPATRSQTLTPDPVSIAPQLPAGTSLPLCPVQLNATMSVSDSSGGWLLWSTPEAGSVAAEQASVPYTVTRIIHWSGYLLLAVTALLVAVVGALGGEATSYAEMRRDQRAAAADGSTDPGVPASLPVMAAIYGALTAVTTGVLTWTDLVPGMALGGVLVIGLIAAVLVAVGDRLTLQGDDGRLAWWGLFISLWGTAMIALLVPFVLLHGANIGWGSAVAWVVTASLLIGSARFRVRAAAQDRLATPV